MRNILFLITLFISVTGIYTLIYSDQAIAQEKKSENPPLLITQDDLTFSDLVQIPNTIKAKRQGGWPLPVYCVPAKGG